VFKRRQSLQYTIGPRLLAVEKPCEYPPYKQRLVVRLGNYRPKQWDRPFRVTVVQQGYGSFHQIQVRVKRTGVARCSLERQNQPEQNRLGVLSRGVLMSIGQCPSTERQMIQLDDFEHRLINILLQ